jgi:hypothetical protein
MEQWMVGKQFTGKISILPTFQSSGKINTEIILFILYQTV